MAADETRNCNAHLEAGDEAHSHMFQIVTPSEVLNVDLLIHESMHISDALPRPTVFGSALGGERLWECHDVDELPMRVEVATLGRGIDVLHSPDVPQYPEMARFVFERLGWDADSFYAYRCRVDYPVIPSLVRLMFTIVGE